MDVTFVSLGNAIKIVVGRTSQINIQEIWKIWSKTYRRKRWQQSEEVGGGRRGGGLCAWWTFQLCTHLMPLSVHLFIHKMTGLTWKAISTSNVSYFLGEEVRRVGGHEGPQWSPRLCAKKVLEWQVSYSRWVCNQQQLLHGRAFSGHLWRALVGTVVLGPDETTADGLLEASLERDPKESESQRHWHLTWKSEQCKWSWLRRVCGYIWKIPHRLNTGSPTNGLMWWGVVLEVLGKC